MNAKEVDDLAAAAAALLEGQGRDCPFLNVDFDFVTMDGPLGVFVEHLKNHDKRFGPAFEEWRAHWRSTKEQA